MTGFHAGAATGAGFQVTGHRAVEFAAKKFQQLFASTWIHDAITPF
jgi:hypothetical protein